MNQPIIPSDSPIPGETLLPSTHTYTLTCAYTGIPIAAFSLIMQAGKLPYLAQWKDSLAIHPLFSLNQRALLSWTRRNWNSKFKEAALEHASPIERQQFQIAFVAILHSLGSVQIQSPCLPQFETVSANMQRLLELAYWQNYLESKRFRFPTLRISRANSNTSLGNVSDYLSVCESVKKDWESSKDALAEEAQVEAARRAEKSVRASHVRAVSKRALWNWFLSCLLASNKKRFTLPEWEEWKTDAGKLFFASEHAQTLYKTDDVDDIVEVALGECPQGNIISHAFFGELNKIRTNIKEHNELFEVDWSATLGSPAIQRTDAAGNILNAPPEPTNPGAEPIPGAFYSRIEFIRAQAKWKVQMLQWKAWHEKYGRDASSKKDDDDDSTSELF